MPASPLSLPAVPPTLKSIGHYLKTANEHETRDPVITYWCRLSALQNGLKLDKKSKEALAVLLPLMDWLEKVILELNSEPRWAYPPNLPDLYFNEIIILLRKRR